MVIRTQKILEMHAREIDAHTYTYADTYIQNYKITSFVSVFLATLDIVAAGVLPARIGDDKPGTAREQRQRRVIRENVARRG